MIDVPSVLADIPHFDKFCSVDDLHEQVARLRADSRFEVKIAGHSVGGIPIHQVRFGMGRLKALVVAFPHCMEPMGGLTVYSLLHLLQANCLALTETDVEWHVVPCIDPDGARLNEGWTQEPFSLDMYLQNFYLQAPRDQVDMSFPITHKNLHWSKPSREAGVMKQILDEVRPDFFFSLHNTRVGGGFYYLTRDIGSKYYRQIHELLRDQKIPIQKKPIWSELCAAYAEGIVEMFTLTRFYDYMEQRTPHPEAVLKNRGACSWDYLAQIKPEALTFVAEFGHVCHPDDVSGRPTGQNLRHFQLRLETDAKYLVTVILEEWEKVKAEVDRTNPFYRALADDLEFGREQLGEGRTMAVWRYPTRDILFNPELSRTMTEADRFNACLVDGGFWCLANSYQFVRLLKSSKPTDAVTRALSRLESTFDEALSEIKRHVDFSRFEVIPCDSLARAQLGSGLIAINALLETKS